MLRALGHLARGMSALFWGLPIALVVCVQSAKGDWFRPLGIVPPILATGLLFHGIQLLGGFQKQERIWMAALDRARVVALINLGASPFLFWSSRVPSNEFFNAVMECLLITGVTFLYLLNPLLVRLTAMLPDENLRAETRGFAAMNCAILGTLLAVLILYLGMIHVDPALPSLLAGWLIKTLPFSNYVAAFFYLIERSGVWLVLFPVLFPVAMTMALMWKIKEVILASVFGGGGSE